MCGDGLHRPSAGWGPYRSPSGHHSVLDFAACFLSFAIAESCKQTTNNSELSACAVRSTTCVATACTGRALVGDHTGHHRDITRYLILLHVSSPSLSLSLASRPLTILSCPLVQYAQLHVWRRLAP